MKEQPMSDEKPMGQVIQIDEARIRDHLGEMVRGTVEETLNAMLDAEAHQLCGAGRYERSQARQDTRAGSYERTLQTSAGEVSLKVPKLRRQTFETAIIERYRRRESSVEEALIEMYLAGVSVRRVEDITEALWGTRVSPSTVSNLNKKIYTKIEAWRNRRIEGEHPYLYLDGIVMKRTWAGEVRNVSLLVASAVNSEGFREILGICEGAKEDKSGWSAFLRQLVDRGLKGVPLIISDACRGRADHERDSPQDPGCWSVSRRPVMPQPGGRAAALHRRHGMVRQVLHEHATSLSAAGHANRSRRLNKCAKDSGHYRGKSCGRAKHPQMKSTSAANASGARIQR